MSGKGSKQRPTDHDKFSAGWDKAFDKKIDAALGDFKEELQESMNKWVSDGANCDHCGMCAPPKDKACQHCVIVTGEAHG